MFALTEQPTVRFRQGTERDISCAARNCPCNLVTAAFGGFNGLVGEGVGKYS